MEEFEEKIFFFLKSGKVFIEEDVLKIKELFKVFLDFIKVNEVLKDFLY